MNMAKWESIRAKGTTRFIWVNGFVLWGLSTAIIWSVAMYLINPQQNTWSRPLAALVLFPLLGVVWALWVWSSSEKKYRQHINDNNGNPA